MIARRRSIRWRLPLSLSALVVAVLATFSWAAYRELKATLVRTGGERAQIAANQLGRVFNRSALQALTDVTRVAADPDVSRYLQQPTPDGAELLRRRLAPLADAGARRIEVWNASGVRVLDVAAPVAAARLAPSPAAPSRTGVGPFQMAGDSLFSDVVAEIRAASGSEMRGAGALGHVVLRSRFSITPPDLIARLIGREAVAQVGNTTDGTWTDLARAVPPPPVDLTQNGAHEYEAPAGRTRLGAVAIIPSTPWAVWVEFPYDDIIAPARASLRRTALIALGVVVLAAWLASSITTPLGRLNSAAAAIAAGDYSHRVATNRNDELGQLGESFNQTANQIEQSIATRIRSVQLEEENRRALEANRLKSEFLANMSHELRTPLNAIIGFTELMQDGKAGAVQPLQREFLGDVLTSSRHLLQLIDDVLDLAKVESGRMEFRPVSLDLQPSIAEALDTLRPLAASRRISISLDVDAHLGGGVVDPARLRQVLYNSVSNALKFTPAEGRVAVRVVPDDAGFFRLEVEDTGVGIRPDEITRLFVEFQQLDGSASKKHSGTGLGLALNKRIVEAQGGRVAVTSTYGKGSTFFAVLPQTGTPGDARPRSSG